MLTVLPEGKVNTGTRGPIRPTEYWLGQSIDDVFNVRGRDRQQQGHPRHDWPGTAYREEGTRGQGGGGGGGGGDSGDR